MNLSRKHPNAGIRCPGHNYRSRCIYHIVLHKAAGFPDFSEVVGIPDNHQWPPKTELSDVGQIIFEAISNIKSKFPHTSILRRCIMPDHVHFAIFIKEETDIHLGNIISALKEECSYRYEAMGNEPGVKFFIPNYHDTFLTGKDQLQKMLAYISDNPRRYLIRRSHLGWFRQFHIEKKDNSHHEIAMLKGIGNADMESRFEAYGNWELLFEYQRVPVKISRKYSEAELISWKKLWHVTILNDGVLVSPFINPNEKIVRDWAMNNGGSLILITHEPFSERFKPQGKMFDLCAEGRLLIVSVPPNEKEAEYIREKGSPSYAHCQRMNSIAKEIADKDFKPI